MNGFSVKDLFLLTCCPPWPSKIAEKIAFRPPRPSYTFSAGTPDKCEVTFLEPYINVALKEWENMDCFFARTARGNTIACLYLRCCPPAQYTILFSHGNASDIGLMYPFFIELCRQVCCNVFGYDYSGYGASSGRPSEKNMYADINCAWDVLTKKLDLPADKIILYGQSLGTVPTVDLAARNRAGAVILHSPLSSALRVVCPGLKRSLCCDIFLSIDKVEHISSPVLVIHGDCDETVPFSHGLALYDRCQRSVKPLWLSGAGHSSVECHDEYMERLKLFLFMELKNMDNKRELDTTITEESKKETSRILD